ncbi:MULTISPECIES: hypothetical protein [unclassified Variovorax]|uniref:hypothetical protein n=1 Tax=unclassified Variovorax TaxID=663243 RepID=UPI003ED016F8
MDELFKGQPWYLWFKLSFRDLVEVMAADPHERRTSRALHVGRRCAGCGSSHIRSA